MAWTALEVIYWIDREGGTIRVKDGKPYIDFNARPKVDRASLIDFILPHLKAHRSEIIHGFFCGFKNVHAEQLANEAERRKTIADMVRRAVLLNKRTLYIKRNGKTVYENEPPVVRYFKNRNPRKVVIPLEREATAVCVEGEPWRHLPKVTTKDEDEVLEPKKFKRTTTYRHNENPAGYIADTD